jgi:hypothetical protein
MVVTRCDLPTDTAIDPELIRYAFFTDSYRVRLRRANASVVDIFFAVFGHHPAWLKAVLLARHRVGALIGLRAARTSQILNPSVSPFAAHTIGLAGRIFASWCHSIVGAFSTFCPKPARLADCSQCPCPPSLSGSS